MARMTKFPTRIRQSPVAVFLVRRPEKREALRIVDVPVEDVEVVAVQECQELGNGIHGEKLAACVEHEASMRVEIGVHRACVVILKRGVISATVGHNHIKAR